LEALPRDRRIPKFRQITVAFGCPEPVETLRATGDGRTDQERITDAVRQWVVAVGAAATVPAQPTLSRFCIQRHSAVESPDFRCDCQS
jgi:hypothetical protein